MIFPDFDSFHDFSWLWQFSWFSLTLTVFMIFPDFDSFHDFPWLWQFSWFSLTLTVSMIFPDFDSFHDFPWLFHQKFIPLISLNSRWVVTLTNHIRVFRRKTFDLVLTGLGQELSWYGSCRERVMVYAHQVCRDLRLVKSCCATILAHVSKPACRVYWTSRCLQCACHALINSVKIVTLRISMCMGSCCSYVQSGMIDN